MKKVVFIVLIVFLSIHCSSALKMNLSDQPPKPDLIIKNVTYKRIILPDPPNPDHLGGVHILSPQWEFVITVENAGAAEWWGDFYVQYDFYSEQNQKVLKPQYHLVLMEGHTLQFKETINIVLPPQWFPFGGKIKKIIFTVNPTLQDTTLEAAGHPEEFFTHNNSYQLNL